MATPIPEGEIEKIDALELRPEVAAFAQLMERKLRANDHKPGWKADRPEDLSKRVEEEWRELDEAVVFSSLGRAWLCGMQDQWPKYATAFEDQSTRLKGVHAKIGLKAADVANMAMMVADVLGALPMIAGNSETEETTFDEVVERIREGTFYDDHDWASGPALRALGEASALIAAARALDSGEGEVTQADRDVVADVLHDNFAPPDIVQDVRNGARDGDRLVQNEARRRAALSTRSRVDMGVSVERVLAEELERQGEHRDGAWRVASTLATALRHAELALADAGKPIVDAGEVEPHCSVIGNTLALFAAAIKCGEPFTSYCENAHIEAKAALAALSEGTEEVAKRARGRSRPA